MFLTVHGGQDLLSERSDVLGEASDLLGRQVLYSETQAVSWNGGKQFAGEGGGGAALNPTIVRSPSATSLLAS